MSNKVKATIAMKAIIKTAKEYGLEKDRIEVQLNDAPMTKGDYSIYIDGDVYDLYNDYSGKFSDAVDVKISKHNIYLERYTYSILDIANGR